MIKVSSYHAKSNTNIVPSYVGIPAKNRQDATTSEMRIVVLYIGHIFHILFHPKLGTPDPVSSHSNLPLTESLIRGCFFRVSHLMYIFICHSVFKIQLMTNPNHYLVSYCSTKCLQYKDKYDTHLSFALASFH